MEYTRKKTKISIILLNFKVPIGKALYETYKNVSIKPLNLFRLLDKIFFENRSCVYLIVHFVKLTFEEVKY